MTQLTRADLRTSVYDFLGTKPEDKFYPVTKVDRFLNIAYTRLVQDMQLTEPNFFRKKVTLVADGAASRLYTFASQAPAIADFSRVLTLRLKDEDGALLQEISDEFIDASRDSRYSIIGEDENVIFQVDKSVSAGSDLYLRYEYNPFFDVHNVSKPEGIPGYAHELIALDACELLFPLGGESIFPKELRTVRDDMKASMFLKIGRRSMAQKTARVSDNA